MRIRRSMAGGLLALATALATLPGGTATAEDDTDGVRGLPEQASPRAVLATAERVLRGSAPESHVDATMALQALRTALPSLRGEDARQAEAILARPTDGAGDPFGDGYTTRARRTCGTSVCVHWVGRTADAPPSRAWVDRNRKVLNRVFRQQVSEMGYRKPLADGRRGGNNRLDVYLKDIGSEGLYGYCVAEGRRRAAPGYCVLDNDFSRAEFGTAPADSMEVTAAHELFHTVQYAYDSYEDPWLFESTATWMEERLADGVNDNRQYLRAGQLGAPGRSLDTFDGSSGVQYGNWIFWEHLSGIHGDDIVKDVWDRAGSRRTRAAQRVHSVKALSASLSRKGGLRQAYARFANDNVRPARSYPEGGSYPRSSGTTTVQPTRLTGSVVRRLDHLSSWSRSYRPAALLAAEDWRLRLELDLPARSTGSAAHAVVVGTDDQLSRHVVRLNRRGNGRVVLPFSAGQVQSVDVSLVNASTRYRCWRGTSYACQGRSRDDGRRYRITFRAFRPRG